MLLQLTAGVTRWWVGGGIRRGNGIPLKPNKCPKNAPRTHKSATRLVGRLDAAPAILIKYKLSPMIYLLTK